MKRKTKRALFTSLLLMVLIAALFVVAYPRIKTRLFPPEGSGRRPTVDWAHPSEVLGAYINGTLPDVTEISLGAGKSGPGGAAVTTSPSLSDKTEQLIKETVTNLLQTVQDSAKANVSINQDKIVQDVTAKLLQQILAQMGTASQPVDRAVVDACTNIINTNLAGRSSPLRNCRTGN